MNLNTPVWVKDMKGDRIWCKILEWYDLQVELGFEELQNGNKGTFNEEVMAILKKGSGIFRGRYRLSKSDPRIRHPLDHVPGKLLLPRLVTHGIGRFV